jgi:hypothetical protein
MKSFHHFRNGFQIDDWTINDWIRKCLKAVDEGASHWSMGSGDTSVIAMRYASEIQVVVANDNGKSTLRFSTSPGWEDALEFESYVRPELDVAVV